MVMDLLLNSLKHIGDDTYRILMLGEQLGGITLVVTEKLKAYRVM
jgi:hypothetical protein